MNPVVHRHKVLGVFALLLFLGILGATRLRVHYHFENFFPVEDPQYLTYKEFREAFSVDDRLLMLAVKVDPGLFNIDFLNRLAHLEESLSAHDLIVSTHSLASLKIPVKTPLGYIQNTAISRNPEKLSADSINIMQNERLAKQYISKNKAYTAIYIELVDSTTDSQNRQVIRFLRKQVEMAQFDDFHLAGFINTQVNYIELLEKEIPLTSILVALGLGIILLVLYRSPANALLLTSNVLIGLVLFFGYLGWIGRTLNITSTLFITIMIIVGISDIIHLQTYYHKYLSKNSDRLQAITKALREVRLNLFLTSITTAVGFLTFTTSSIPHIYLFGIDAAVGVLIAFLISVTLSPVAFYYFPPNAAFLQRLKELKKWGKFLFAVYRIGKQHKTTILIVTLLMVIISLGSLPFIKTNQTLSGNFSPRHQIKKDIDFFEEQFGGIRGFELYVISRKKGRSILDPEILTAFKEIEGKMEEMGLFGPILSPWSWLQLSHQIQTAFRNPDAELPLDEDYIWYLAQTNTTRTAHQVLNEDFTSGRLATKIHDIGIDSAAFVGEQLLSWIEDSGIANLVEVKITGSAVLIDSNNKNVNREMFLSLGIAFLLISILMAILFRRLKMVLISIIPNIVPLLAVGGLMSLTGIHLNAATSLIFTIGFVIAIDDTIHFLTRFRSEYQSHKSLELAINNTLAYTGRAVVHTTIILFCGYITLMVSSFKEIYHHSILVAATLVLALIADLFLLPALLRLASRKGDLF